MVELSLIVKNLSHVAVVLRTLDLLLFSSGGSLHGPNFVRVVRLGIQLVNLFLAPVHLLSPVACKILLGTFLLFPCSYNRQLVLLYRVR